MYPTGSDGTYTSYDLFLCNSLYGSFLLRVRDRHFLFFFFLQNDYPSCKVVEGKCSTKRASSRLRVQRSKGPRLSVFSFLVLLRGLCAFESLVFLGL